MYGVVSSHIHNTRLKMQRPSHPLLYSRFNFQIYENNIMEDAVTHQSMHIYENNIDFLLKNDLLYLLNFNKLLDFLVVFYFILICSYYSCTLIFTLIKTGLVL